MYFGKLDKFAKLFFSTYWGYSLLAISLVIIIHFFFPAPTVIQPIFFPKKLAPCFAKKIIDGDSFIAHCNNNKKHLEIRLADIDAPEWSQKPWGNQSKNRLQQLVIHKPLDIHIKTVDIYQRYIATVYHKNTTTSVNEMMLKEGMATSYAIYKPPKNYLSLVKQSKQQKLGIWKKKGLHQDPKKYRRLTAD